MRRFVRFASLWLGLIAGTWPLAAEKEAVESLRFVEWESLGFSADGRYFADLVYGVEYSQEQYFARLRILGLTSNAGKLVFERILRRSHSSLSQSRRNVPMARAIAQDLLRRESRMLNRFQIEAMELGEVLPVKESVQKEISEVENPEKSIEKNIELENSGQVYTAIRAFNGNPVFELRNLRLDQDFGMGGVLRGSLSELQGGSRSYYIEQEWDALVRYGQQPNMEPVFMSVSPNIRHLVITLRIYREPDLANSDLPDEQIMKQENQVSVMSTFRMNENYDFVSFALRVY